MPQVMILFQFLSQVHHAGRVDSLPKHLNIPHSQLVLIFNQSFIEIAVVHGVQSFPDESAHLIFHIIIDQINNSNSHFLHFLF